MQITKPAQLLLPPSLWVAASPRQKVGIRDLTRVFPFLSFPSAQERLNTKAFLALPPSGPIPICIIVAAAAEPSTSAKLAMT